ncbi:hypothetical protein [Sphingobacterium sp. T2]|uniref:hypothetical protein n=1 Tax=Sphingobacterium sp. T2 TaxID=1590596 RepID=UPI000A6EDF93|nr:hypothetical protein [Sphingobacterium sp. T2]
MFRKDKSTGFLQYVGLYKPQGKTLGYIKEKKGNGSIIPGWVAHGLGNFVTYFTIAFVL